VQQAARDAFAKLESGTSRAHLLPPEESSERLAGFIVDALLDAGIVARNELDRAVSAVAGEIEVNKAMADYWCMDCPLRPPEHRRRSQ